MKALAPKIEVIEVENEGLISLLGQRITLFCANYIYTGKLEGVNATFVKLVDAAIVYETGPLGDKVWKNAEALPNALHVQTASVESFMVLK